MNKQTQKSGDQSTNIQADQMVVNVGIDEKRAREVFQEMNLQLRREYAQEALKIANDRVSLFEDSLMPKMEQVDGALEAFSDPSFQLLLHEAQKTAACTERPADYDLLSELLLHRFKKGDDRVARAGIGYAVDIVDKISDEALLGLTVAHAVSNFSPATGEISQGLDLLDELYGKIIYRELPTGQQWLDHLDILNAVRLNTFGGMKKIAEYYPEKLAGYIDVGIMKDTENHTKAIEILSSNNLPEQILAEHSLNSDYLRIQIPHKAQIESFTLQQTIKSNGGVFLVPVKLTETQVAALISIYDLYNQDGGVKQGNIVSFTEEWDSRPHLKTIRKWWDDIPLALSITSAGQVLAHANAQRCDSRLPPMN